MKFRFISIPVIICLAVLSLCSCDIGLKHKDVQTTATDPELLEFTLDEAADAYAVSAKEGAELPEDIVIPATYNDKAVVAVKSHAFENSAIVTLTLPAACKTVGASAFSGCKSLKKVTMSGVVEVKNNAFLDCSSLRQIEFPKYLKTIGKFAFSGTSIYRAEFAAVEKIDSNAFYNCKALKDVSIPAATTFIAEDAFDGCSSVRFTVASNNANYTVDGEGAIIAK